MPFGIQPIHIVIIVVIGFLLFGANKLPELGRSLGKTLTEFRKGTKEAAEGFKEEMQKPVEAPAAPAATAAPADNAFAQPAQPAQPAPAVPPSGNFCINFGAPNLPEARFCANCGSKLPEKMA